MKLNLFLSLIFLTGGMSLTTMAQDQTGVDSTGLPGDNFSLQGALEMFKKAASPEEFEKLLNTEDNHVNNLDLNEDGEIDYIRVIDRMDKKAHALILQVPVSDKESQDVAVIELERTGDESAVLQIIGDEDLYGEEVIVEPADGGDGDAAFQQTDYERSSGPGAAFDQDQAGVIVNVWLWPSVRFLYAPGYAVWTSPWRWRTYPAWWHTWRPARWYAFHPYVRPYHTHFVVVRTNRVIVARNIYRPIRVSSVSVRTRHSAAVGNYRVTRSRTTVTGPRGNTASRQTTTVRGRNGAVKSTKTKVRRRR